MPERPFETHDVTNQSPPFADTNLFASDASLTDAVKREGGTSAVEALTAFGARSGSAEAQELARLANRFTPVLETHDGRGRRRDEVIYHPAYHELMALSAAEGLTCSAYEHVADAGRSPNPGANVIRSAGLYLAAQMGPGHCCPLTMTNAAVPALLAAPDLAKAWLPKVLVRAYDRRFLPPEQKTALTIGMGMTEKQGGTDVRANATTAAPAEGGGEPGRAYVLTGHKWFLSAPMSDAFLMLAQAPKGLSCFLVPRFLPDGSLNALRLQRLKEKVGNRSNASSEVEIAGAQGFLVGEEGRGIATIIEMVTATRLDCAVSSAGLMRLGLAIALHHTRHRTVFQRKLAEQPIMGAVLADLALDAEAATALAFRLARAFDRAADPRAAAWRRLMTPVTKFWVCKIAPAHVYESMECMGGNGYVEEGLHGRLYREVPVNAIWEGSGNVMCLDVLRVLQREPEVAEAVIEELRSQIGDDGALKTALGRVERFLHEPRLLELRARAFVEGLALVAAGSLLRAHAPTAVADAFIATRLTGRWRHTYGQGLERADVAAILARTLPE